MDIAFEMAISWYMQFNSRFRFEFFLKQQMIKLNDATLQWQIFLSIHVHVELSSLISQLIKPRAIFAQFSFGSSLGKIKWRSYSKHFTACDNIKHIGTIHGMTQNFIEIYLCTVHEQLNFFCIIRGTYTFALSAKILSGTKTGANSTMMMFSN